MSLNVSNDLGIVKSTQSEISKCSRLVNCPIDVGNVSRRLQFRTERNFSEDKFPICGGNDVNFFIALKSRRTKDLRSHKLSGSSVMPLHFDKFISSMFFQFPIDGGMLDNPIHFENDTSTSETRFPIEVGSSFTALHSRISNTLRDFRLPIESGNASSSLHLSNDKNWRLDSFPILLGKTLRTLFPEP